MARTGDILMLKSKIKEVLEYHLYAKPIEIYGSQLRELIIRSALLRGDGILGFRFKGRKFTIPGDRPRIPVWPRLSPELEPSMLGLLASWDPVFDVERPQVLAYISHVLNASDDPMEYLPRFPSGLRQYLTKLYEHFHIPIDGLEFRDVKPAEGYQVAYDKLCSRVTFNLLLE